MRFYLRMTGAAGQELRGSISPADGTWRDGSWHHMLWAWRATEGAAGTGALALYLDGAPVSLSIAANTITSASPIDNWGTAADRRMKIGAFRTGLAQFFDGCLDDLAAWGVELTAIEAKALYELGNEMGYDAVDAQVVLDVFAQGPGGIGYDSEGRAWEYRSGLSGTPGELNALTLVLDAGGNGVVGRGRGTIIMFQ
jgi:hypothetical protein